MSILAVTVSLHPAVYDRSADEQYEYTRNHLYEVIKNISCVKDISMRAELTKNNHIHWHLAVWLGGQCAAYIFKEILDSRLNAKNKELEGQIFGFTCVKRCKDVKGWIHYINKKPYEPEIIYLFDPMYEVI